MNQLHGHAQCTASFNILQMSEAVRARRCLYVRSMKYWCVWRQSCETRSNVEFRLCLYWTTTVCCVSLLLNYVL